MRDSSCDWSSEITIRRAGPADAPDLRRLAELETRSPTAGPHLLALREGRIVAAISLSNGEILADPFQATLDVQELLGVRARGAPRAPGGCTPRRRLSRLALSGA